MPRRMRMYPGRAVSPGGSYVLTGKNATLTYGAASSGTTHYAASLAPADIQAKIDLAVTGDTVQLPAGSRTYSGTDNITCSKAIHIKGAGGGRCEGRSTTSVAVGVGTKSFTIVSGTVVSSRNGFGPGFDVGETIRAVYIIGGTNYMEGTVTSWDGTTLVLSVTTTGGSGTYGYWAFVAPASTTLTHTSTTTDLFTLTKSSAGQMEISDMMVVRNTVSSFVVFRASDNSTWTGKPIMFHDMRCSTTVTGVDVCHSGANGIIMWRMYCDAGFQIYGSNNFLADQRLLVIKNLSPDNWGWNRPDTMGDADTNGTINSYIEDTYFCTSGLCTDWDDNSRGIERYCVYNNSSSGTHGSDSSGHGLLHVERYNNKCYTDPSLSINQQCFFDWRGGSGILADNEIPDISIASGWGAKPEIKCQIQNLQRKSQKWGMWGKNASYYATNYSGNVAASIDAYPSPRQCGMSHPTSGNVTTDVKSNSITKSLHAFPATTYTLDARAGDSSVLTGIDDNTSPCYMGNLSPIYSWGNSGTGEYTNIYGENYQTNISSGNPAEDGDTVQAHFADAATYFVPGTNWVNSAKPGYNKYTYPHPLRTS